MVSRHPEDVFEMLLGYRKGLFECVDGLTDCEGRSADGILSADGRNLRDAPSPARIRPSSGPLAFSLAHSSLLLLKEQWISEIAQSLLVMMAAVPRPRTGNVRFPFPSPCGGGRGCCLEMTNANQQDDRAEQEIVLRMP